MRIRSWKALALAGVILTALIGGSAALVSAGPKGLSLSNVATASARSDGYAPASKISKELDLIVRAQGSTKAENPTAVASYYGYDNDTLNAAGEPQMLPTQAAPGTEAHKTEPDKNTYLVFPKGLTGADPHYDYGTHFLFQGHEGGAGGAGYITRINLDADAAHRVTILATTDTGGNPITTIDGSTWDPFAQRRVYTPENAAAPTYAATPGYPSTVEDVSGALGRGGYEGIQDDGNGNLWISEDVGGGNKPGTTARLPNSFLFRYVPATKGDLHNGKLQVLQVLNEDGVPITKASQTPLNSDDQLRLHTYGLTFRTSWVTIHDTATDGTTPFSANALATAADGTPFKRPENANFVPDGSFTQFVFDETGDTDSTSVENDTAGGWGSLFRLTQSRASADHGTLSLLYKGDAVHAGFDNMTFVSKTGLAVVEDAGDKLHGQRNALDSGWLFDITADFAHGVQPIRWLAEGRDASATIDASFGGFGKNDGDNELTGVYASDGDITKNGILGAKQPQMFRAGWRWFYTQQHGDNPTYEVVPAGADDHGQD